jgi:hypothetical protein
MEGGIIRSKVFCIIGPNALECEWKYMNWKDFTNLTNRLLSSKKEVEACYGEDSGDDESNTKIEVLILW